MPKPINLKKPATAIKTAYAVAAVRRADVVVLPCSTAVIQSTQSVVATCDLGAITVNRKAKKS